MPTPAASPSPAERSGDPDAYDVVIVGGGPAGLAAALILGRARRRVAVVDAAEPAHFATAGVHGLLGHEGVPPRELRRHVWSQLAEFPVEHVEDRAVTASRDGVDGAFSLGLAGGRTLTAPAVLLAGGLRYTPLPIDGLAELWGERVFHCPFCHGWEVRDRAVISLAPAWARDHVGALLALWTPHLTVLDPADVARVEPVGDDRVRAHLTGDRPPLEADAIHAAVDYSTHDDLAEQLGVRREARPPMFEAELLITTDPATGATSVPGVYAAGDASTQGFGAVPLASGAGANAAYGIVRDTVMAALHA